MMFGAFPGSDVSHLPITNQFFSGVAAADLSGGPVPVGATPGRWQDGVRQMGDQEV